MAALSLLSALSDLHGPQEPNLHIHLERVEHEATEMVGVGQRL